MTNMQEIHNSIVATKLMKSISKKSNELQSFKRDCPKMTELRNEIELLQEAWNIIA